MKILSVVVLVLLLSASFCAKNEPTQKRSQLVAVTIDSTDKAEKKYVASKATVAPGDSLTFTAEKIKKLSTIIFPMADMLFQLETEDKTVKIEGTTYLFIPLSLKYIEGKSKEWTSRKFLIIETKKSTYEYSIFINDEKKMAEEESSPKIIVDP